MADALSTPIHLYTNTPLALARIDGHRRVLLSRDGPPWLEKLLLGCKPWEIFDQQMDN